MYVYECVRECMHMCVFVSQNFEDSLSSFFYVLAVDVITSVSSHGKPKNRQEMFAGHVKVDAC